MTSVHFPSNYPIWPLWDLIAWEPWIPSTSKQGMLLFAAATVRHRDRKQILIIVWTHRGKKYHLWVTVKWVSIAKLQNTVVLCVPFPVPRNAARLMTRGGVGEVNDITGWAHIWILTQWHLVFLFTPHLPAISSLWSLGLCSALPFLPPSKNTSFSLPPLKQLPVYEVQKMTLHLMMNGTWPLEPVPVGAHTEPH